MIEKRIFRHKEKLDSWPLIEGVKPIRICVGRHEYFEYLDNAIEDPNTHFLDWNNNIQNTSSEYSDRNKYGIMTTSIDSSDKYSPEYLNCTGILLVGENASGETISCLTHQNSVYIADSNLIDIFNAKILKLFEDFKNQTQSGTVEILTFGGNLLCPKSRNFLHRNINEKCISVFNQIPRNIFGPKIEDSYDDLGDSVFFDTKNRRLFFMRNESIENENE